MSRQKFILFKVTFLVFSMLSFFQLFACRYTVREIGYTDLGDTDFHLYLFVNKDTDLETIKGFQQVGYAMLLDTNVKISIVNLDTEPKHTAIKYIDLKNRSKDLVEIMLVSPLGKAKLISKQKSFDKEEFWNLMDGLVSSKIVAKMTNDLALSYGALLLVEGKDAIENNRIQKVAKKAIQEIRSISKSMAKPIDVPVRLYVLPYKERQSEDILLWSLGVSLVDEEPFLVTLFGRGRMMGSPLKGKEINVESAFKLLSIIGADCECGLDRKWMLGSTVPLRWSMNTQAILSKDLGFDIENPMVKSEMSQILSIKLPLIEKITPTTFVNSLEKGKEVNTTNRQEDVAVHQSSAKSTLIYTLLAFVLFVGFGVLFFFKKNNH